MNRRDALKQTAMIMGYAVSASTFAGVMAGCEASGTPGWKPSFLTEEQGNLVAELAECIIPTTDTIGAKDALVHEFIDVMYGKFMKPDEKANFSAGLLEVEKVSQSAHNKSFTQLGFDEQTSVLTGIAKASEGKKGSFFSKMKELTTVGYFKSERVGREVLNYLPIPGAYKGCVPLEEVGNVNWTI